MVAQIQSGEKYIIDQMEVFSGLEDMASQAQEIGETILQVSQVVIDFASIYRVPRYCPTRKESNVEHSFMLGLVCSEVVPRYYPGLDVGLSVQLALVHDLPELKTGYDVATFDLTEAQLKQKHADEQAGLPELLDELPPHLADLLEIYEEKKLPESKLVDHLDKNLPNAVNIIGAAGVQVMAEDYDVNTSSQFLEKNRFNEARFQKKFQDPSHDVLHKTHSFLANRFALQFNEV